MTAHIVTGFLTHPPRWFLAFEAALIFIALPLFFYAYPMRMGGHLCLWLVALYAAFVLSRQPDFSWRRVWDGLPLTRREGWMIAARMLFATVFVILLTQRIAPERFLQFPTQKPVFWLVVMLLYPVLSVLPQELVFRAFFFQRYQAFLLNQRVKLVVGAVVFGFLHIVFHNLISPFLSFFAGFFLTSSYLRHASLKKAAIEHALYGDMVFTVGLGFYFLVQTA